MALRGLGFAVGGVFRPKLDIAPEQLFFRYAYPGAEIVTCVAPLLRPYMNAPIHGFFDASAAMDNASISLMSQNILYVGDLAQLSRDELVERLGRDHEAVVGEIETMLRKCGLGLSAIAPWWERPTDYYRNCY
jgi:hypothetical protein